jgi:hypothetical protein
MGLTVTILCGNLKNEKEETKTKKASLDKIEDAMLTFYYDY